MSSRSKILNGAITRVTVAGMCPQASPPVFDQINRNKRSLKLNLKQPEGVLAFMDLVAEAHVVMEGFRPGVMTRLGIDFPQVRDRNPAIVFCAISGYGQDGPLRDVAGHDINYCGYAGVLHQCGARDGPPSPPNFQIADLLGGTLCAVMGILAALVDAQRCGKGRYLDVSMTDCTLAHSVVAFAPRARGGRSPCTRPGCSQRRPALLWRL